MIKVLLTICLSMTMPGLIGCNSESDSGNSDADQNAQSDGSADIVESSVSEPATPNSENAVPHARIVLDGRVGDWRTVPVLVRTRPRRLYGDRAYDSQAVRNTLKQKGIRPYLAKRNTGHGSGLGKWRWVAERTISWLHGFRHLRFRWERRADIHQAFLILAACIICIRIIWNQF